MSGFEKAKELITSLPSEALALGHNIVNSGRNAKEAVLGGTAVFAAMTAFALTAPASSNAETAEVPVDGGLPTIEECNDEATNPPYLATPSGGYRGESLRILDVDNIDVAAMSQGCADLGDRTLEVFAQTKGKKGNWGRYSNIGVIDDDSANTWSVTLTTRKFKGIPGPATRAIRFVSRYSFTPEGSSKPTAVKSYPGKRFDYGPNGDGV